MSDTIRGKTKNSIIWNLALRVPNEITRFALSIVVARLLDPRDFGIVSIASMLIFYANSITNFGLNQALVQRKEINASHVNSVFTLDLAISLSLAIIFNLLSPHIAAFFNSPESESVIRVLSLIFIITTFHDIPYTLYRRDVDFKTISLIDGVKEISIAVLTVALAYYNFTYWAIVWGQLIPTIFATLFIIYQSRWIPRISYSNASIKDLIHFGAWNFLGAQVNFFSKRLDRIIIGRYMNPHSLGIYDKGKSISQMPTENIAGNIHTVFFSSFSRVQGSDAELKDMLKSGMSLIALINFPLYFGLYVIAPQFVLVLLGSKWSAMIKPLQIMCMAGLFTSFTGLITSMNSAVGKYKNQTIWIMVVTGCWLVMNIYIVQFGIDAVALGVLIYNLIVLCIFIEILRSKIRISWGEIFGTVSPYFFCSLVMLGFVKVGNVFLFQKVCIQSLLFMLAIGILSYGLLIMIFPDKGLIKIRGSIYENIVNIKKEIIGKYNNL